MSSQPSRTSLPAIIGGLALVLVAAFFGIDLGGGHGGSSASSSTSVAAPSSSASNAVGKSSTSTKTATTSAQKADGNSCPVNTLPAEADTVIDEIRAGGPFEYPDNDGVRFGNYEGVLPKQSSNYYREYTVDTPGLNHRGERRIVTGGGSATDPDVWYYTDDHYESFCQIPDAEN